MNIGILNCKSLLSLKSIMKITIQTRFKKTEALIRINFNQYNASMSRQKLQGFTSDSISGISKMHYHPSILNFKIKHNIWLKLAIQRGITNNEILKDINEFVIITQYYVHWFNSKSKKYYLVENEDTVLDILYEHQEIIKDLEDYKHFNKEKIFTDFLIQKLSI